MHLRRLEVSNFRNLKQIDLPLTQGAVLVGENRSGKSNLLHAVRLLLDPALSSVNRTLTTEDFSESLGPDPMGKGAVIEISVELEGFDDDEGLVATLGSALISGEPMVARLTYRFGPRDTVTEGATPAYEWTIYGGGEPERRIGGELRRYLHHVHMHALRDAEGDIGSWRRSPLRPLLETAARDATVEELEKLGAALEEANSAAREVESVSAAEKAIESATADLVGELHRIEPRLDLAPADPERTLRSLRLFIDGEAQRRLGSASLGSLNVLYIALMQLELQRLVDNGEIEYALISVEEPEAHLHPHLQRRMFGSLLAGGESRGTVISTHSPHIVSVTPPRQLIVLREVNGETIASAASTADLSNEAWDDLGRYLDATRSELVFARRVLLVEGFAEQVLIPLLTGDGLDDNGISVCPIHGVHFGSYVAFLRALGTPVAVITDGDPASPKGKTGAERVARLAKHLGSEGAAPESLGLFAGDTTFETDLFSTSARNQDEMLDALKTFYTTEKALNAFNEWRSKGVTPGAFLKTVGGIGKGRFAQRLSVTASSLDPPSYIESALKHLLT